mgnify:CR=1 FL=1
MDNTPTTPDSAPTMTLDRTLTELSLMLASETLNPKALVSAIAWLKVYEKIKFEGMTEILCKVDDLSISLRKLVKQGPTSFNEHAKLCKMETESWPKWKQDIIGAIIPHG